MDMKRRRVILGWRQVTRKRAMALKSFTIAPCEPAPEPLVGSFERAANERWEGEGGR
jgi:hypothetical protein